jgi:hypothetical protein
MNCIELVSYKLKSGIRRDDYMKSVNFLQENLLKVNGFGQRAVYYNTVTDYWVEVVSWESEEVAKTAEQIIMALPEMQEGMNMIETDTINLQYLEKVL